jgi:hypothetical protein
MKHKHLSINVHKVGSIKNKLINSNELLLSSNKDKKMKKKILYKE